MRREAACGRDPSDGVCELALHEIANLLRRNRWLRPDVEREDDCFYLVNRDAEGLVHLLRVEAALMPGPGELVN